MGAMIEGNEDYKNLLQNVKDKSEMMINKRKVVKKGMNREQEAYAEFSKRGKEEKNAEKAEMKKEVAQEKIADEFALKKAKEKQMKQWKGLTERTKMARAKGLILGENTSRGSEDNFKRKLGDRSNSDSKLYSNRKGKAEVKVNNIQNDIYAEEVKIPTATAYKLEEIPTDYARYINKEGNKEFVQENVEQIINARDLLAGEKGKAKDLLPAETFKVLQDNLKFLKLGPNTLSETLYESLKTVVKADLIQQGQQSAFRKYVGPQGNKQKKMKKEGEVNEIPYAKDNKPRKQKEQINPSKENIIPILSGRAMTASAGGGGFNFTVR